MKRTYQPSKLVRKRRHGFRARTATTGGRKVLAARRSQRAASGSAPDAPTRQVPMERLKQRADFLAAAAGAQGSGRGAFVLQARARGDAAPPRFGFTVSKKVGNAVERNRVRRRLREVVRRSAALPARGRA